MPSNTFIVILLLVGIITLIVVALMYLKRRRGAERESQTLLLHINDSLDDIMSRVDHLESQRRSASAVPSQAATSVPNHGEAEEFWAKFDESEPQVQNPKSSAVGFGVSSVNPAGAEKSEAAFWNEFNQPMPGPERHDRATQTTLMPRSDRPKRLGRQTLVPQGEQQAQLQQAQLQQEVQRMTMQHTQFQQGGYPQGQRTVQMAPQFATQQMRQPVSSGQQYHTGTMNPVQGSVQQVPQQRQQVHSAAPGNGGVAPAFQQPTFQAAPQRAPQPQAQRAVSPHQAVPYQTMTMQRPEVAQRPSPQGYPNPYGQGNGYSANTAQRPTNYGGYPAQQTPQTPKETQQYRPTPQSPAGNYGVGPNPGAQRGGRPQQAQPGPSRETMTRTKFEDRSSGQDRQGRVYSVEELMQQIK